MPDEKSSDCGDCGATFATAQALGGHRKAHGEHARVFNIERMHPRPECFSTDEEWEYSCRKLAVEDPHHRNFDRDFALAEACAICEPEYMRLMESKAMCHPPAGAWPQRDLRDLEELEQLVPVPR